MRHSVNPWRCSKLLCTHTHLHFLLQLGLLRLLLLPRLVLDLLGHVERPPRASDRSRQALVLIAAAATAALTTASTVPLVLMPNQTKPKENREKNTRDTAGGRGGVRVKRAVSGEFLRYTRDVRLEVCPTTPKVSCCAGPTQMRRENRRAQDGRTKAWGTFFEIAA